MQIKNVLCLCTKEFAPLVLSFCIELVNCVDLHVVAIDLPGHGKSSHRPRGSMYNSFQYVADVQYAIEGKVFILILHLTIHYIVSALQWEKFSFLGHSLGKLLVTIIVCSFS